MWGERATLLSIALLLSLSEGVEAASHRQLLSLSEGVEAAAGDAMQAPTATARSRRADSIEYVTDRKTYAEAQSNCEAMGGDWLCGHRKYKHPG
jgi:hypothetical protein